MTARTLLRLLLLHDRLETADDWDGALEEEGQLHGNATDMDDEQEARRRRALRIVGAIGDVVPHLPNYSAVSTKLTALMHYGEKVDAGQLHQLVQQWLQQSHRTLFRKWLVCDWLQCSQLTITAGDAEELVQWRHALVVATLHEVVKSLKWTLLRILHAVNEAMETRCTDDRDAKGTIDTSTAASMQAIGTVEELLDFCFLRAEQLASYSLLCAAKLHALAVKTQRSATKLVEDEEVLVRLRWAFMLKPMLFRPLLQHAIALRTIAEKSAAHHVRTSTALSGLVNLVDATSRATILLEMRAMGNELDRAFARGAKHIRRLVLTSTCRAAIESAVREYVQTLSNGAKERLLAELERDLDEAPPHLFPHIFIYLSLLLGATLSPRVPGHQNPVTFRAVSILLSLFDRRGHDVDSCQDVLGQLLHPALADDPMWLDEQNSSLYIETIARLSETATIQVEPQKLTWVVTMALHYLLFECDVKLLHRHQATLTQCVPQRTVRLVNIRLGNC
ncbi:unnamed protein product [Hyaloperonospora brassicae]|uniref:Uncharacterized protein n=1 Tax=Hyaloperonospora brassicae TaxID=162125 RepID=A0AAV0U084_HYABA|nr:unnamed protein product [Hyaloperonospora brassicae]